MAVRNSIMEMMAIPMSTPKVRNGAAKMKPRVYKDPIYFFSSKYSNTKDRHSFPRHSFPLVPRSFVFFDFALLVNVDNSSLSMAA